MIGVIANPADKAVIQEFFELFKTPWELYESTRKYDVVLCAIDPYFLEVSAKLVVIYAGKRVTGDVQVGSRARGTHFVSYNGSRIPIYGDSITLSKHGRAVLVDERTREPVGTIRECRGSVVARLGYDLFSEIRTLLTAGQPAANAGIPTLELHIAVLRDLILASGAPLLEIAPIPEGYRFIACLTHDMDNPSIRLHRFDHTIFGFLYRAVFGTLINVIRGRRSFRALFRNWTAALNLPLVHLGVARDFWNDFDRYPEHEGRIGSSFFVIPFKDTPGLGNGGPPKEYRAARYCAADIASHIRKLADKGCEIGLHGIDAWIDSSKGRDELQEIRRITDRQDIGVRMHWLYFDRESYLTLEEAGADYDSTLGYNETVGYRAGTTQVFKPLETTRLLELPMHIMDTALFFPAYLDLSPAEAGNYVRGIIDNAVRLGGCVTVNWHDRSIAPERLWDDCYFDLVAQLKKEGAWFATAGQVVSWFRWRRSAVLEETRTASGEVHGKISLEKADHLPQLRLRVAGGCVANGAVVLGTHQSQC
jgi:hypothetical protein